jgi:hypothetical protein
MIMRKTCTQILAALLLIVSTWASAVVPINGGLITLTRVSINTNPGDQYDPHVDQDIAVYSELIGFDQSIHYYLFSTGLDATIPRALPGGANAQDFLSDVQGRHIVFNRYIPGGDVKTMLFDIASASMAEINPQPGSIRYGISIGGNTIAYADMGVVDPARRIGEIYAYDLNTRMATRLTNDLRYDDSPSVSPVGDVIVWESCQTPFADCDILGARYSLNGGWAVSTVAGTALNEMFPATTSTLTTWAANPGDANGWDIHWVVAGSVNVQRLQLADDQFHPKVAGDVIAFESQNPTTLRSDLLLYDIASNRVFQLTNTSTVDETLNDITRLPNGDLRIVWQANDDTSTPIPSNNIYAATFRLPPITCRGDDCDEHGKHHHNHHDGNRENDSRHESAHPGSRYSQEQ